MKAQGECSRVQSPESSDQIPLTAQDRFTGVSARQAVHEGARALRGPRAEGVEALPGDPSGRPDCARPAGLHACTFLSGVFLMIRAYIWGVFNEVRLYHCHPVPMTVPQCTTDLRLQLPAGLMTRGLQ